MEQYNSSPSVDPAEVTYFKQFAERWWSKDWTNKTKVLLAMNAVRVPFIKDGLISRDKIEKSVQDNPKPFTELKILDVGCGAGYLTEALAKLGAKMTGLDPCKELCESATEHAKLDSEIASNTTYVVEGIEDHSKKYVNNYDAVVASEVLEHVNEPRLFLESCVNSIKPGGSIFITTINRTYYSFLIGIVLLEYITGDIPKGTHDWNKFISPCEVTKILEENNCEVKSVRGTSFNPITKTWNWGTHTMLFYGLHAVKKE